MDVSKSGRWMISLHHDPFAGAGQQKEWRVYRWYFWGRDGPIIDWLMRSSGGKYYIPKLALRT